MVNICLDVKCGSLVCLRHFVQCRLMRHRFSFSPHQSNHIGSFPIGFLTPKHAAMSRLTFHSQSDSVVFPLMATGINGCSYPIKNSIQPGIWTSGQTFFHQSNQFLNTTTDYCHQWCLGANHQRPKVTCKLHIPSNHHVSFPQFNGRQNGEQRTLLTDL